MFGGGTDHPKWFRQNGGSVVSFSIDKYSYITLRELPPFFSHKFRVAYSKVETTDSAEQIVHPAVREAFIKYASEIKLELHHHGDLPAQSGVGSSSAFAVGLIKSL
jgi:D-glycero-alpha-D-manno-heptose-7-phosphate kinase